MIPAAFGAALAALDRRLDGESNAPLAVALSGGSDSLALLRIVEPWAAARRRGLLALTVDHRLHPDSAAWTQTAGEEAAELGGVQWRALAWTGPKPASGVTAAARLARHALLAQAARAEGAHVLLLGHTADDAAESELIRTQTPTHGRLAEWSPSPVWPEGRGVFLLRPLLSLRRADLQAWLAAQRVRWMDDPANSDLRFARSRARASLEEGARTERVQAAPSNTPSSSSGSPQGSDVQPGGHWRAADALGWADLDPRAKLDHDGKMRGEMEALLDYGVVDLPLAALLATERPMDALARALLCVSGRARPPAGAALARLLARLSNDYVFTATLSGARLRVDGGHLRLTRELGRSPPALVPLTCGGAQIFDGRFEVVAQAPGWRVGPLTGHAASLPKREREVLRRIPSHARSSLPVLLGPEGEARLPQPFGAGAATARCQVGLRLASAWALIGCERALEQAAEL
ncbi:tRNA lysidine(34) synthetase TilS [Caulobacter sp. S45]|uniref:tRNA lysidine(34) synthetase TilS n=1 Tax=Caulobacter sp. S45 TaxID=1641861 RepID=UPI001575D91A|nr:tRNA lysidine(34) synthetase TilS [Caulobacter sp. S45]